jgi:NTE family protein
VAVVAAGAGARGAYEAGALSVLVPWLCDQGRRPTIFVGTSAGAINATLFAAVAHLPDPRRGADQVLDAWRLLTVRKVFRPAYRSLPLKTLPAYVGQLFGLRHVGSLLDTTPIRETAQALLEPHARALHKNIHGRDPVIDALAVVATDDSDRTTVFLDHRAGLTIPPSDDVRGIGYVPTTVNYEHVMASSAIPVLFAPVRVGQQRYVDGGVRLNVPLKPAVDLGAKHLAVVATHPATYPGQAVAASVESRSRNVVDGMVTLVSAVLADRMVEDLRTLGRVNEMLQPSGGGQEHREIDYVFVGPRSRHELGTRADVVYHQRKHEMSRLDEFDLRLLRFLIGRREDGAGDLLSYVFFDHAFINDAIGLGIEHATEITQRTSPWQLSEDAPPTSRSEPRDERRRSPPSAVPARAPLRQ